MYLLRGGNWRNSSGRAKAAIVLSSRRGLPFFFGEAPSSSFSERRRPSVRPSVARPSFHPSPAALTVAIFYNEK